MPKEIIPIHHTLDKHQSLEIPIEVSIIHVRAPREARDKRAHIIVQSTNPSHVPRLRLGIRVIPPRQILSHVENPFSIRKGRLALGYSGHHPAERVHDHERQVVVEQAGPKPVETGLGYGPPHDFGLGLEVVLEEGFPLEEDLGWGRGRVPCDVEDRLDPAHLSAIVPSEAELWEARFHHVEKTVGPTQENRVRSSSILLATRCHLDNIRVAPCSSVLGTVKTVTICGTITSRTFHAVMIPKLPPPPPRKAQKKSSPIEARSSTRPSASTIRTSATLSAASPYFRIMNP
ncbi:epidermal growth factor receptor kinase substrate 8-like protein 3 [Striga asiatica]|uniref:Epidermal growth factor receptor kinase substrate 8-like protein 3 n=1 Tax=Striga asiatica TaxID=4170 RepID=A0A5A7QUP5_STRAF|nr:epidermal growth factor receptor kinase substrate 8-like protein 3 [Striga asiatica]